MGRIRENRPKIADVKAEKYVEARIRHGMTKVNARTAAGYSEATDIKQIERVGGPVANKMQEALEKYGINEDMLAQEYAEGIQKCKQPGAKDSDFSSHAKYLGALAGHLGHGRKEIPGVAIQINTGSSGSSEPGRLEGLADRLEGLLGSVEEEIGRKQSSGLHAGDPGTQNSGSPS